MRKETISKKIVALFIAAAIAISALTIAAPLSAQAAGTVSAGNGEGSILYSAHRAPGNWDPCFATSCDAGTGPGATMYFVVYDSTFGLVTNGHADESGVTITGLQIGGTYYLSPEDCESCHDSTHDVVFNNWEDCSTERQRAFTISSASQITASATYRIVEEGAPDEPVPCSPGSPSSGGNSDGSTGDTGGDTGGSTGGGSSGGTNDGGNNNGGSTGGNNGGSGTSGNNNGASDVGSFETGMVDPIFYFKMVSFLNDEFGATTVIAENGTEIVAPEIPDTNLSGQPLDSDPSLTYAEYNSLYEVVRVDPASAAQIMRAVVDAGIPWEHLSDMQKAYIILKVKGSSMDATLVDLGL